MSQKDNFVSNVLSKVMLRANFYFHCLSKYFSFRFASASCFCNYFLFFVKRWISNWTFSLFRSDDYQFIYHIVWPKSYWSTICDLQIQDNKFPLKYVHSPWHSIDSISSTPEVEILLAFISQLCNFMTLNQLNQTLVFIDYEFRIIC